MTHPEGRQGTTRKATIDQMVPDAYPHGIPGSNILLMLMIQASNQLDHAIEYADKIGAYQLRKKLHVVETLLQKAKGLALYEPRCLKHVNELVDTLPDISDLVTSQMGSWMQLANKQEFRTTIRLLSQMQRERLWRNDSVPSGYQKGSFVPVTYENEIPRYRAIRSMLSALKLNSVSLSNIHNIALASRFIN